MLWFDQAVACKFDFGIIVIFTKMSQNTLEMDEQKGVPKRTVINLREMAGVGDGLKVFKATNFARFVVLQSVKAQWFTTYMSSRLLTYYNQVLNFRKKVLFFLIVCSKKHGASWNWLKTQLFAKVDFSIDRGLQNTVNCWNWCVWTSHMKAFCRFRKVCEKRFLNRDRSQFHENTHKKSKHITFLSLLEKTYLQNCFQKV